MYHGRCLEARAQQPLGAAGQGDVELRPNSELSVIEAIGIFELVLLLGADIDDEALDRGVSAVRILAVCTANVCRSPVAERMLQRDLDRRGVTATVRSAGTHGGELGVHRFTAKAAAEHGIDLGDHRSRLVTPELIETDGADLVITMTRDHLYSIVADRPDVFRRAFTLRELARRTSVGFRADAAPGVDGWLDAISIGRSTNDVIADGTLDLDDPYGGPKRGHRAMVETVEQLSGQITTGLAAHLHRSV